MEPLLAPHAYPALALLVVGLGVTVWGVRRGVAAARRAPCDPWRALALLCGFRIGIIGLALAGLGAAWCWQLGWLSGLSLIIGGEELLESTVIITALRHGARVSIRPVVEPMLGTLDSSTGLEHSDLSKQYQQGVRAWQSIKPSWRSLSARRLETWVPR